MKDVYGFFFYIVGALMLCSSVYLAGLWLGIHHRLTDFASCYLLGKAIGLFCGSALCAYMSITNFRRKT